MSENDRLPFDSTDVLIVGGGAAGCLGAYYAAQEKLEVAVLDEVDLHSLASGANSGTLHQQLLAGMFVKARGWEWVAEHARMVRFLTEGRVLWKAIAAELDTDIQFKTPGGIVAAETDDDLDILEKKSALERANGANSYLVSKSELVRMAPYVSEKVIGACYCPDESTINPLVAMPAVVRRAEREGVSFLRRTKALRAEKSGAGFLVHTTRGTMRCRRLVIAAGLGAPALAQSLGVSFPITSFITQNAVTVPTEPMIDHLLFHATRRLTMKQTANGNVLFGGGWLGQPNPATAEPMVAWDSVAFNAFMARHIVPAVGGLDLLRVWTQYIFAPEDGSPICGEVPGMPGLYLAISSTMGLALGPVLGRLVADMVAGKAPFIDPHLLRLDRFAARA
jgi:glycine/D-amino acid oxidase-like deaminating enzyme